MSVLEFISSLIGSVAWPLAVIVLVFIVRRPLGTMLTDRPLKTLEAGPSGVKLEYFDEKLEEARSELRAARVERPELRAGATSQLPAEIAASDDFMDEMRQLAGVAPSAVILVSFACLERVLRDALESDTGDRRVPGRRPSARQLGRRAVEFGLIAPSEAAAFDDVSVLRNVVAHGRSADLDADRALSYALLVRQLIISIRLAQGRTIQDGPIS